MEDLNGSEAIKAEFLQILDNLILNVPPTDDDFKLHASIYREGFLDGLNYTAAPYLSTYVHPIFRRASAKAKLLLIPDMISASVVYTSAYESLSVHERESVVFIELALQDLY